MGSASKTRALPKDRIWIVRVARADFLGKNGKLTKPHRAIYWKTKADAARAISTGHGLPERMAIVPYSLARWRRKGRKC
jgi:hypothetical protein